jgi:hypothetical protein
MATAADQTTSVTNDDLKSKTTQLKIEQDYYDQQLATAKSKAAAAEAATAANLATLNQANQVTQAQITNDLAVATALKNSGLTQTAGKEGTITIGAAADKSFLVALQVGSLQAVESLTSDICAGLKNAKVKGAFIAPLNYESLVEKSVLDIVQLKALHQAAISGKAEYAGVQMQMAIPAVAGALISAQYLAGGVQSITKLFRSDYSIAIAEHPRSYLFEQELSVQCPEQIEIVNIEPRLRLSAAYILDDWLNKMAEFVEINDRNADLINTAYDDLKGQRDTIFKDAKLTELARKAKLKATDEQWSVIGEKKKILQKYKVVVTQIKTYLSGLNAQSSIYDSLVWGQVFIDGGVPVRLVLDLKTRPRFSYVLTSQDAAITKSSTFLSNKIRGLSTVEATYSVTTPEGKIKLVGANSKTIQTKNMNFNAPSLTDYNRIFIIP